MRIFTALEEPLMSTRIIRRPEVERRIGLSRSSIYALMQKGVFPQPVKLGARAVGWREEDIQAWIDNRPVSFVS